MGSNAPWLIAAEDLTCSFSGNGWRARRVLFEGATFSIAPGERVAVSGPNGSGKTTLLRLLLGLGKPARGRLTYSAELGAGNLAYLPENPRLPAFLTVGQYVAWMTALGRRAGSREISLRVAQRFGVSPLLARRLSALSKGELARVALVPLAASDARLFLLDEPLDGLDEKGAETFSAWMGERCAQGSAFVFSTHVHTPLGGFCDRVLRLTEGKIWSEDRVRVS